MLHHKKTETAPPSARDAASKSDLLPRKIEENKPPRPSGQARSKLTIARVKAEAEFARLWRRLTATDGGGS